MPLLLVLAAHLALAEAPAAAPPAASAGTPSAALPTVIPALETPAEVQLTPEGDVYLRTPDRTLARIGQAAITAFEAHCDAAACDLVLRTDSPRP